MADSYRNSGRSLDERLAQLAEDTTAMVSREKTVELRRRHLKNAQEYYQRAMEFFGSLPEQRRSQLDEMYLRHCYLYRADCLFDLGQYREAAHRYEAAIGRYQLTPTALAAFVQMVNCQIKLGYVAEASSTNERAIWQLRKMPDSALAAGPVSLAREQWEDWFDWTGRSGLW